MAKTVSEEETQLRKRARRRLVGSITLVIAAVVILPMVLDSKPEQRIEEIDIRIPSEDAVDELGPESEAAGGSSGKVTSETDVSGIQGATETPNQAAPQSPGKPADLCEGGCRKAAYRRHWGYWIEVSVEQRGRKRKGDGTTRQLRIVCRAIGRIY